MATADLEALRAFRARVYVCLGRRRDALFELLVRTGDVVFAVTFRGLRQAVTPDHLQGWVSATIRVATNGLVPAGAQIEGILGDLVGLRTTMLAGGLGVVLAFLVLPLSSVPSLGQLPEPSA
jgi:hypothetical protein